MRGTDNTSEHGRGRSGARLTSLMKAASSLAEQGLYDEAIARIREAMAINPGNVWCSVQLANIYRAQRRMGLALDAMQRALELDPRNYGVGEQLLQTLVELGRYDEAIKSARRLLLVWPKNLYARDVMGVAYLQQGKIDKALEVTNELIQLAPTDPVHHFKKAVLLQQKGETAQAMASFTRSLQIDPNWEMAEHIREAITILDNYQIRQILLLAVEDTVFRAKLSLNAEEASLERGFLLSSSGFVALRQLDLTTLPRNPSNLFYH